MWAVVLLQQLTGEVLGVRVFDDEESADEFAYDHQGPTVRCPAVKP